MGTDSLIFRGRKIVFYKEGIDPYRPGVDVVYEDGCIENLRLDINIFLKEVKNNT